MGLERLPAELQLEIFRHLANRDLKAARAVSRKLCETASPALFRSVVACARYQALGALQKISLNAVLPRYVKEIVFDGSLYNNDLAHSADRYQEQSGKLGDIRLSSSFWGIRGRWKRYKDLYTAQEEINSSGILLQTIARALERTTNVASIVYSPHPHLIPIEAKVVRDLIPRNTSRRPRFPASAYCVSQHPFLQLVGAIYVAQYSGIRELRVDAFDQEEPGTPLTLGFFSCPKAIDLQAARYLFQHLENCELNVRIGSAAGIVDNADPSALENNEFSHLDSLLAAAHELRHLALHAIYIDPFGDPETDRTLFSRFGLRGTWPKLQSLSLAGMAAHGKHFSHIIRRHKDTLRSLAFRRCTLLSGTWADIVDEVLYSTKVATFVLQSVNEAQISAGDGTSYSSLGMEKWMYEGYMEASKDIERNFVNSNPTKKSVYHLRVL